MKKLILVLLCVSTSVYGTGVGFISDDGTGKILDIPYKITTGIVKSKVIDLDIFSTNTLEEGEVGWNSTSGTMDIGLPGGTVTLQVGQESLIWTRNQTGSAITNGWVIYQTGFSGNKPLIDISNGGHPPLGIATENIGNNSNGYVALRGLVRDVDTSLYLLNAELYASTNGVAITNRPAYPNEAYQVGRVAKVHQEDGVILAESPTCTKTWTELDEQYKPITNTNTVASASNVGRIRYYTTATNSYVDISMQTDTDSYSWVNIQSFGW